LNDIHNIIIIIQKMFSTNATQIPVEYTTGDYSVRLNLNFGEGKDSEIYKNENDRKKFSDNYTVEVYESGEGDNYTKGYRVVTNEGPLVIKLGNISIVGKDDYNYDYAVGFAVDNSLPEYTTERSTIPYNIERDGTLWTIPANDGNSYNFDQNPNGRYQWVAKRAMDIGYEPTKEELELGMEKTSEGTGLIYLTFMVFKKPRHVEVTRGVTRGATRGATRGVTRGGDQMESDAARFGYGNEASTSSRKSDFEYAENTERYVLPIRLRINKKSATSEINCSQHLKGANVNTLRRQTMTVPF
jgi:hypothetical protein